jgi:hypothetical protein
MLAWLPKHCGGVAKGGAQPRDSDELLEGRRQHAAMRQKQMKKKITRA